MKESTRKAILGVRLFDKSIGTGPIRVGAEQINEGGRNNFSLVPYSVVSEPVMTPLSESLVEQAIQRAKHHHSSFRSTFSNMKDIGVVLDDPNPSYNSPKIRALRSSLRLTASKEISSQAMLFSSSFSSLNSAQIHLSSASNVFTHNIASSEQNKAIRDLLEHQNSSIANLLLLTDDSNVSEILNEYWEQNYYSISFIDSKPINNGYETLNSDQHTNKPY